MRYPSPARCALLVAAVGSILLIAPAPSARGENVSWAVDAGGQWTTAANWSSSPALPGPTSDVSINRPAGDFLVTLSSGNHAINSLVSAERLTLSGGTLSVATTLQMQNTLTLAGATLANAALSTTGGGVLAIASGTLNNVSIAGTATALPGSSFIINSNLTLSDANLQFVAIAGYTSTNITANTSLLGAGSLTFNASGGYSATFSGNGTLTVGAGVSLLTGTGNSPTFVTLMNAGLINQGLVSARTPGAELKFSGTFLTNSGILEATNGGRLTVNSNLANTGTIVLSNGVLSLGGSLTQAALGNVARTGGTLNLTGTLAGGLALNAATGSWNLAGGTLLGGTLTTTGGAALVIPAAGTFDNVTLGNNLAPQSSTYLTIKNNLNLNGNTLTLNAASSYPTLNISGINSFNGSGVLVFDGSAGYYGVISGDSLTLTPAIRLTTGLGNSPTIGGAGGAWLLNQGVISSVTAGRTFLISATTFDNAGLVEALNGGIVSITSANWVNHNLVNASSSTLTFANNWSNSGTITATNSVVNLGGTLTAATLGTLVRSGGTVNLTGSFGGPLALTPATGSWNLLNGTLVNSLVTATGGATLHIVGAGTFDNVTLATDLTVTGPVTLNVKNGLTLNNSVINLASNGGYVTLQSTGAQTLGGSGTLTFEGTGGYYTQIGGGSTLTLGPAITLATGSGNSSQIGNITLTSLFNQGLISIQHPRTFTINVTSFNNAGTLEVKNGGTLSLAGAWTNTGPVNVTGATFTIASGAWSNNGTISASNAVLNLGGSFTQAGLGSFVRTGGTVNLTGLLSGGLALGPATGSWNLAGGTLVGGTLSFPPANLFKVTTGGTLDGITLANDLTIPDAATVAIRNGLNMAGVSILLTAATGYPTLQFTGSQTLNNGTITLAAANGYYPQFQGAGTVSLGPGMLVETAPGNGNSLGSLAAAALQNQGVIAARSAGRSLSIGGIFSSSGTLTGPGNFVFSGSAATITGPMNVGSITLGNTAFTLGGGPGQTAGVISGSGNIIIETGTHLTSDGVRGQSLTVNGSLVIRSNGGAPGVSKVDTLAVAGTPGAWTGKIDLRDNGIIIDVSTTNKAQVIATLQSLLLSGRNGGTFDGPGITSSTVSGVPKTQLVLADNDDMHISSFRGSSVSPAALVITSAHDGDASLDGNVDSFDLNILAAHWQQQANATWSSGDFTLDGAVDSFDLNVLAANWQYHASFAPPPSGATLSFQAALAASGLAARVPEPASLALLASAPLLLWKRRPRRAVRRS